MGKTNEKRYPVDASGEGLRLDKFLAAAAGLGLRGARRAIGAGCALVDGASRGEACKLRPGQVVSLLDAATGPALTPGVREITRGAGFAALYKPAGLHTASLAGGGGESLEALLPLVLPGGRAVLVNRLDRATSGIVLAALDLEAAGRYKELEDAALVDKRYLAVVHGLVAEPVTLRWAIDMDGRAKVRVLEGEAPPLRWTHVLPLASHAGRTLVEARIAKGARHQIRAHLARAGHPIIGDALYGEGEEQGGLRLHHWRIALPGLCTAALPEWDDFSPETASLLEEYPCD